MRERRFFAPSHCWHGDCISLDTEQSRHITTVLRLKIGNSLICFDETGRRAKAHIASIERGKIVLTIESEFFTDEKPLKKVTLAQSLIKPHNMDFIVQKSVELGVSALIPFYSAYSVVKLDDKRQESKMNRWQKIVIEAVQQCERNTIPHIAPILSFESLLETFREYDIIFVAHPYGTCKDIADYVDTARTIMVVIGPEGGFTAEEMDAFLSIKNVVGFKFNEQILRAETAALSSLAILEYMILRNAIGDAR